MMHPNTSFNAISQVKNDIIAAILRESDREGGYDRVSQIVVESADHHNPVSRHNSESNRFYKSLTDAGFTFLDKEGGHLC